MSGEPHPPSVGSPAEPDPALRILVLAPTANDSCLTRDFLLREGIDAEICRDIEAVRVKVEAGCGAILLAEESLEPRAISFLVETLGQQPSWSDIPTMIITSGGEASLERLHRLALLGPGGNVTLLERPFRPGTLISAAESALRARRRQYQVRDLLHEISEARDQAERALRAKDEFLAALSHELRTPLNPVLLLAGAAAENPRLSEKVRADFAVIRKNVNLEARLIDDLLDLTRITRGKLNIDHIPCDIHTILTDAILNVGMDASDKQIRLEQTFAAPEHTVLGDPVRLQQIFWNVLKNAVKFTPESGRVRIETHQYGGESVISVRIADTGIGLVPADMEHIFDAFSQGRHEPQNARRYGGLGLGLSISRKLVELHSGTISVSSPGLGQGSVFSIDLPLTASPRKAPDLLREPPIPILTAAPASAATQPRILLVEDHDDTRMALSFLLGLKYKVVTAADATQARAAAASSSFDLVISDIGLPDETGYQLMAALRDQYRLRGVALTGYGMEDDILRSREAGFIAHLTKPVEIGPLELLLGEIFASQIA
ncbi:hypothetical protein BH09VER1_BH09VER1_23230 [soil metagenome]